MMSSNNDNIDPALETEIPLESQRMSTLTGAHPSFGSGNTVSPYYSLLHSAAAEPPLKILVPAEFVGAVIGKGGSTIRAISKSTGARLDILRNCSRNNVPEIPITIFGPAEKASNACCKILEILVQEMEHQPELNTREVTLRMFAQDRHIGRVIGKGGNTIKKIMEDSQTKIQISTQPDYMEKNSSGAPNGFRKRFSSLNERLITIRGTLDEMCRAETLVSEKLREAYQNEVCSLQSEYSWRDGGMGDVGLHGSIQRQRSVYPDGGADGEEYARATNPVNARRKTSRTPFTLSNAQHNQPTSHYIPGGTYSTSYMNSTDGFRPMLQQTTNLGRPETVHMYIPDDVVGALIGRKGNNIRQIIQQTGASIKIMEETLLIDENRMRRVVINGAIDSLFKAQYLIYDKVVEEGKEPTNHQIDDIRLTVEMSVPTEMVGRLIGKNGQNIRDIQKNHLCRIKFMTDPDETLPTANPEETYVRITGNYNAFTGAQRKIREMLFKAMTRFSAGYFKRKDERGFNNSGNSDNTTSPAESSEQYE